MAPDLSDLDSFGDGPPHAEFRRLREVDPVHRTGADGGEFWSITRYDDLQYVSSHPEIYSSATGGTQIRDLSPEERALMDAGGRPLIQMDPPAHSDYRRLVQRSFTPRLLRRWEAYIRQTASEAVQRVAPRGHCEFVSEVAAVLPFHVICEMMGVPEEERADVLELTNAMIGFDEGDASSEARQRAGSAVLELYGRATQLAQRFRADPGENLTSEVLSGELDGRHLSDLEYCSFFILLITAGNETTRNAATLGMKLLIEHPDQLALLRRQPSLIPNAVDEILRYEPPVLYFRRTALRDDEIRGQRIQAGDRVVLWYPSANRDAEVFDDADVFDVERKRNQHVAFGVGAHHCLGTHLARIELAALLEEIVERLRDPEIAGPVQRFPSNFVNCISELPIRFVPRTDP